MTTGTGGVQKSVPYMGSYTPETGWNDETKVASQSVKSSQPSKLSQFFGYLRSKMPSISMPSFSFLRRSESASSDQGMSLVPASKSFVAVGMPELADSPEFAVSPMGGEVAPYVGATGHKIIVTLKKFFADIRTEARIAGGFNALAAYEATGRAVAHTELNEGSNPTTALKSSFAPAKRQSRIAHMTGYLTGSYSGLKTALRNMPKTYRAAAAGEQVMMVHPRNQAALNNLEVALANLYKSNPVAAVERGITDGH